MFEDLTYKNNQNIQLFSDNDKIASEYTNSTVYDHDNFTSYSISTENLKCNNKDFFELYFSNENIQNIQNRLRYGVYLKSKKRFIIPEQSIRELGLIMESMYYQYSKKPKNKSMYKKEIEYLNDLVLEYSIPSTLTAVESQHSFLNLISRDVIPSYEYEYTSNKGLKTKLYNPGLN